MARMLLLGILSIVVSVIQSRSSILTSDTAGSSPATHSTSTSAAVTTSSSRDSSVGLTSYYYMDSLDCSAFTQRIMFTEFLSKEKDDAYVAAWSPAAGMRKPQGSCAYTIASYSINGSRFHFDKLQIGDCSVKVRIFSGRATTGKPMVSNILQHS